MSKDFKKTLIIIAHGYKTEDNSSRILFGNKLKYYYLLLKTKFKQQRLLHKYLFATYTKIHNVVTREMLSTLNERNHR